MDLSNLTVIVNDGLLIYDDPNNWQTLGVFQEFDQDTHHAVNAQASFTFTFNGTDVAVRGTLQNGLSDCRTQWTLDGGTPNITTAANVPDITFGQTFYQSPKLDPGEHTLEVLRLDTDLFFFDYIIYTPIELDNTMTVIVNDDDYDVVQYDDDNDGSRWKPDGSYWEWEGTTHIAQVAGAKFQYIFNGTYVGVFGTINANVIGANASFSIDGGTPSIWQVPNNTGLSGHDLFWDSSSLTLEPTMHTLEVTMLELGNGGVFFDYFLYNPTPTGPLLSVSSGNSTGSSSSPSTSTSTSSSSTTSTGAIAGGVVAGVVALLVILAGVWYLRRRWRRASNGVSVTYDSENNRPQMQGGYQQGANPYGVSPHPVGPLASSPNPASTSWTGNWQSPTSTSRNAAYEGSDRPTDTLTGTSPSAATFATGSERRPPADVPVTITLPSDYSGPSAVPSGQSQYIVQNQDGPTHSPEDRPLPRVPKAIYVPTSPETLSKFHSPQSSRTEPRQHIDGGVRLEENMTELPPAYGRYD